MIWLFMQSLIQGAGWTAGSLAVLGVMMAYDPLREWIADYLSRKNGLSDGST